MNGDNFIIRSIFLTIALVLIALPVLAQYGQVPEVTVDDNAVNLQRNLFPEHYKNNSAIRDMRWVKRNDSALVAFWDDKGYFILNTLASYSGLNWRETEFNLYLIRFYPSMGEGSPFIIPLGGMRRGSLVEAAPSGNVMQFNIIFQLARRLLNQAAIKTDTAFDPIADHPLMQPTPYRRDNLAMLLALVTSQYIIGIDSTYDAYNSAFWKDHNLGREIFEQYLMNEWILTPDRPLVQWLVEEPYSSRLVVSTRTPRRRSPVSSTQQREYIEDLPLKGRLGFSVKINSANRLVVDKIDPERLAFACGLEEGDVIRQVDGITPKNHRDLIERLLAGLSEGGATLEVSRDDQPISILIQPIDLYYDEEYLIDSYGDSLYQDTLMMPDSLFQDTLIDSVPVIGPDQ